MRLVVKESPCARLDYQQQGLRRVEVQLWDGDEHLNSLFMSSKQWAAFHTCLSNIDIDDQTKG